MLTWHYSVAESHQTSAMAMTAKTEVMKPTQSSRLVSLDMRRLRAFGGGFEDLGIRIDPPKMGPVWCLVLCSLVQLPYTFSTCTAPSQRC